jgi:prepilin-type processing-associated H-X9-DG protein
MFADNFIAILVVLLIHSFFLVWFIILLRKTFWERNPENKTVFVWRKITHWVVWLGVTGVCLVSFWQLVAAAGEATRFAWCNNMLKQYGGAFHNYRDANGNFPPAFLLNDQGQPAQSWRVLILNMLGDEKMYNDYRFDEPWNGPNNKKLAARVPIDYGIVLYNYELVLYVCPDDIYSGKNDTSIVMPIGPETISDGSNTRKISDITDGTAHTIMAGEMSQSGIHWMEPRDLKTDEMSFKINDRTRPSFRSMHPGGVNVLFVDGAVRAIKEDIDPKVLKAAITISGGEPAGNFDY